MLLGQLAIVDRQIGAVRASVDYHRHAAAHLAHHDPRDLLALGLRELKDLAAQRDAQAMDSRRQVELDQAAQALLVDPGAFVEGRDQDREHAAHGVRLHRCISINMSVRRSVPPFADCANGIALRRAAVE